MTNDELYKELKDIGKSKQSLQWAKDNNVPVTIISMTNICNDCMNGHHEIIGHKDCECSCHGNVTCFYCGKPSPVDHSECIERFDEMRLDNPTEHSDYRYEWER